MRIAIILLVLLVGGGTLAACEANSSTGLNLNWNGHRIHVVDRGEGDALLLVHGLGADLSRWQANIDVLAKHHRVIAVDLLGFGHSDKPALDYRAQLYVDQLEAVLDTLGVERTTLVGNSMGGWVSMLFAEQHPTRTKKLVLIAPAFVNGLPATISPDQLSSGANPGTVPQMRAYLERVYHAPPNDEADVRRLLDEHRLRNQGSAISSLSRAISAGQDVFTRDRVANLSVETVVIHGANDGIVPLAASKALAATLPNATLMVVERAGHWPQLEQPPSLNSLFGH